MSGIEPCNHTSVGVLVNLNDTLLLIERKKFPFGFAPPAGHVDRDETYPDAAVRELREEVGIGMPALWSQMLGVGGSIRNKCRRPGGDWHHWVVYETSANSADWTLSPDEVTSARWVAPSELERLARRTRAYVAGKVPEEDWVRAPGLEPVWVTMLIQARWL